MSGGRRRAAALIGERLAITKSINDFLRPQIGQPGPQFTGDLAPGASELQQQGFELAGSFGSGGERTAALERLLSADPAFRADELEEIFQAGIARPTLRQFERDILPGIDQRFAARGIANSGVRARALALAGSDVNEQLLAARSGLQLAQIGSRERALDRVGPAIQSSLANELSGIAVRATTGETQRAIQGEQMADAFRRFLEAQPVFNPALGLLPVSLNSPIPGVQSKDRGGLGSALGTIAGGIGGAFLGGPAGAVAGASIGGAAGGFFG